MLLWNITAVRRVQGGLGGWGVERRRVPWDTNVRVRYAAFATTLEHNFGTRQGSLMAALGLLNEKALHAKEKKDRTPLKPPRAKRRSIGPDEEAGPSTGYAPENFWIFRLAQCKWGDKESADGWWYPCHREKKNPRHGPTPCRGAGAYAACLLLTKLGPSK